MNSPQKRPELLSPAGSLLGLNFALAYGADAVYAGLPRYSLRVRNNEFRNPDFLEQGIANAHEAGKSFLLAVNLMPHNTKLKTFVADLEPVVALKPDALIMADPGLIMMVRERWPDMPVHLSVQANTVNYASVKFWQSMGVKRVILSRELSLDEVEEIRQLCPDMELEVFVHGALCIAYSGRCLISGYFNHRDSNQGTCTNACRWNYSMKEGVLTPEGEYIPQGMDAQDYRKSNLTRAQQQNEGCGSGGCGEGKQGSSRHTGEYEAHPLADKVYMIEESERRSGDWMEFSEDENGSYLMNSRDLRAIEHVQRLTKIGIDCLKIEGRTKSHYYVARTTQIYRQAIDDALAGREFNPALLGKLDGLANRGYTDGFLQRHPDQDYQNYLIGVSANYRQQFVAEVLAYDEATGWSTLHVKNRFSVGDKMERITPQGCEDFVLQDLQNKNGEPIAVAPGSGHIVRAKIGRTDKMCLLARYVD